MAKWTLTKTTQDGMYNKYKKVNETVYHYESGDRKVAFHSHPTQAFNYVKVYGGNEDFSLILNSWIDQATKGSQYVGGFKEAIKELEV